MRCFIRVCIVTCLACLSIVGAAVESISPPAAPVVSEASNEPQRGLSAIKIPMGWTIELFAAEPDVANIVSFDVDSKGRLFVCESFRQNRGVTDNRGHDESWLLADLAAKTVQDRIDYHKRLLGDAAVTYTQQDDRIRCVVDKDGDGRADQSTIVADGFNHLEEGTGAGVLVDGNNVFFTCIPKLWKLIDQDGDGQAENREAIIDGFGVRVAFRGHDLHGLTLGPDHRLYFSIGDRGYYITRPDGTLLADPASGAVFRCELDGSRLEVLATGLRNPQELAFNDWGDLFSGDNNSDSGDQARIVQIIPGADSGWRMHYQYLTDRGPFNRERIWHPYDPDQPAYIVPPIANFGDGPSGFAFDPGTGVDPAMRDRFVLCDFGGGPSNSGLRSFKLDGDGSGYRLVDGEQPIWNVMATDVAFGPDGALWISDWVQGWDGIGKGRVYRLQGDFDPAQSNRVRQLLASDWRSHSEAALVDLLNDADRRIRNRASWELADRAATGALLRVAEQSDAAKLARLHAIWGLGIAVRKQAVNEAAANEISGSLQRLLLDKDAEVRAVVADYFAERPANENDNLDPLARLLVDPNLRTRMHAALAIAKHPSASANLSPITAQAVELLSENNDREPNLRHAGVTLLAAVAKDETLVSLRDHESLAVRRAAVVALRQLKSERIESFLKDPSPLVVVEAARAIHDLPIATAMPALAALIQRDDLKDDALVRRVLNANFRLGKAEHANAVASFAARPTAAFPHRLEAISMLQAWTSNDPRDRILGESRPLGDRMPVAIAALDKSLDSILANADEVRDTAVTLAADFGIERVTPILEARLHERGLKPESRAAALRSLTTLRPELAAELASQLLNSQHVKLRLAALNTIAKLRPADSLAALTKATLSGAMAERQLAWDLLARIDLPTAASVIENGVQEYLKGSVPTDTALNVVEAANQRASEASRQAIAEHQAKLASENPLGKWLLAIDGGDPSVGATVFNRTQLSCVRCHRVDRIGGEVGPVLTTIGKQHDKRYLLEAICLPDAAIAKGFETTLLVTDDGQVVTGIVREETETTIELMLADGSARQVEKEIVIERKRGKSAMPEDLTKYMNLLELRDLVAYLASLQVDPRSSKEKE